MCRDLLEFHVTPNFCYWLINAKIENATTCTIALIVPHIAKKRIPPKKVLGSIKFQAKKPERIDKIILINHPIEPTMLSLFALLISFVSVNCYGFSKENNGNY